MAVAKRKCETCTQTDCFINKYCTEEWKPIFTFNKMSIDYPKGATIFTEGEPVKGIYQIYRGKIKVASAFGESRERIVSFATNGQILGYEGLGGRMIYPVTAIALEKAELTFIPIDIFYKAIKANPDMALYLMLYYAEQLNSRLNQMKFLPVMSAKEKVAVALITIVNSFGYSKNDDTLLNFTPTRKDIASLAGTTYETVIRVLSDLEKAKIISLEAKSIRVLDYDSLARICENCNM